MNVHLHGHVLPEDKERDIYAVNGHITFQKVKDAKTVVKDGYILPGLVDSHAHLSLASPTGDEAPPEERVRAIARAHLHAGVLTIREPGSPDYASKDIQPDEGLPKVQTGGRFLAPAGRYFPGLAREIEEDQLPDAAEEEARNSGAWAKIIGDFPGEDGRFHPNFRLETLKQAAERVHKLGARIAIHAVIPEVIETAIEAGFDSIEHGTMLEATHISEMARGK
jgi:imidazolonepropionase-like amidohydrolase